MQPFITKDCEVEVSIEKDGFKGAWYRAILGDSPTESGHDNPLRVCYTTLLEEDGSAPVTEMVDPRFVRPVPPNDLNDDGSVFKEGSVVDAYAGGSWWTGVVVKSKEEDDATYPVYFDFSPPDIIQYERKQLRAHLDWTGSKWVRPENKELIKSVFSPGTMVELRRQDYWCPVMIIKELENVQRFIVKYDRCSFTKEEELPVFKIVDSREVRPRQPLVCVEEYQVLDHVEALIDSEWRQGVVRGILSRGLRYMVSFGEKKSASQFSYSDLRPPMEWEDGIWHKRPKPKSGKETRSKSGIFGKYYTRKRKREVEDSPDLNDTVLSSDRTPTVVKHSAVNVEETQAKDTTMVLPFSKKSPIWKTYETMEVFKSVPQSPHFSKLSQIREDFREGYAIGMMETFSGLLEELKDLETEVTVSQLERMKDSFTELKKHGFDVARPLSRIEKLLAYKDRQMNILKERKGLEKEMMVESSKKHKAEQEFVNMERRILKLQWQEAALREQKEAAREQKDAAYKNICQMESCARELSVELEDVEFDFETILSAPW